MVQESFYDDLNTNFASYLCTASSKSKTGSQKIEVPISRECDCNGVGFAGMPALYMDMGGESSGWFSKGKGYSYALLPSEYLQYPKVQLSRTTSCTFGLWNSADLDKNLAGTDFSLNTFIAGQDFIRQFQLLLIFDNGDVEIYITAPSDNGNSAVDITLLFLMIFGLLVFVFSMTHLKKKRMSDQQEAYQKLEILQSEQPEIYEELIAL